MTRPHSDPSEDEKPVGDTPAGRAASPAGLRVQLVQECGAMVRHALSSGTVLPEELLPGLRLLDETRNGPLDDLPYATVSGLVRLHGRLARIVAPAKPYTLYLMQTDPARNSWLAVLGPLPEMRRLMTGVILFVLIFLGACLFPEFNNENIAASIYTLSGRALAVHLVFIMAAAAIGSFFQLLVKVHGYINEGIYEPKYESAYWMRVVMGVISGLILAELLGLESKDGGAMGKPVLALLGGFSGTLLYRILNAMVSKLESLFRAERPPEAAPADSGDRFSALAPPPDAAPSPSEAAASPPPEAAASPPAGADEGATAAAARDRNSGTRSGAASGSDWLPP